MSTRLALGLSVLGLPSCVGPEEPPSDYPLYSAVLESFVDRTSAERLVIRHVAAVDDFADKVYAVEDLLYYVQGYPELADGLPDLFEVGRARIAERPTLADSFRVTVRHSLLDDSTFAKLRNMPFMQAVESADSAFGPGARVVCLTPPARVGDQAAVFLADACFERNALVGGLYFLQRGPSGWRVVGRSNWSEN